RTFERPQGLGPLAVLPPVPEQEARARGRSNRHSPPCRDADAFAKCDAVLKLTLGLMAGAARDRAVRAQPRVEKESLTERRRTHIVRHSVGWIGRERFEIVQRE